MEINVNIISFNGIIEGMKWETSGAVMALLTGMLQLGHSQEPKKGCAIFQANNQNRTLQSAVRDMIRRFGDLPYQLGGRSPEDGGFDDLGAIVYLMEKLGCQSRNLSEHQYDWLSQLGSLVEVPDEVNTLEDEVFDNLSEGDLLFWADSNAIVDGKGYDMKHVGVYLGQEEDGHPIMACSSNQGSYRGRKGSGFGVYDFKLTSLGSVLKFVAYGRLPLLGEG